MHLPNQYKPNKPTHLNEIRDHKTPNTLEYVFGLRESFRPTTISISLNMTKACGIS